MQIFLGPAPDQSTQRLGAGDQGSGTQCPQPSWCWGLSGGTRQLSQSYRMRGVYCADRSESLEVGGMEGSLPGESPDSRAVIAPAWKPDTVAVAVVGQLGRKECVRLFLSCSKSSLSTCCALEPAQSSRDTWSGYQAGQRQAGKVNRVSE